LKQQLTLKFKRKLIVLVQCNSASDDLTFLHISTKAMINHVFYFLYYIPFFNNRK
jgi:hypothetical protein